MSFVDPSRNRYPTCIVWTPIPFITWIFPFIGHTGICDSKGIIYDFAGPYTIGVEHLSFGDPVKYLILDKGKCRAQDWDSSIVDGNEYYSKRMHNLCFDNCHSHCAYILNRMNYDGKSDYNMFTIGIWMFLFGQSIGFGGVVKTYAPFITLVVVLLWALGYFS